MVRAAALDAVTDLGARLAACPAALAMQLRDLCTRAAGLRAQCTALAWYGADEEFPEDGETTLDCY
jgi:hypothetical protein